MTDTTIVAVPPAAPSTASVMDWAAILSGAVVAAALSFVLFTFGAAIGLASVSPFSSNNPSATTISAAGAFWVLVVMIGSFTLGGYFAGRFRRVTHTALTLDERTARDGAHGLAMWAVGILVGAFIAASIASGAGRTAAAVTGHAAAMAAPAAGAGMRSAASQVSSDQLSAITDGLMRADPRAANNAGTGEDARASVARIFAASAMRGSVSEDDKTYLVRVVAARSGVSEDEARKRVDAAIAEAKSAAESAKQAADKARKAAIILAFLIAAGSIIAAGAAYWAATAGGEHRDGVA
ncbi:hypothetical protein GJW-30_1_01303 [Variibacter gotjawalensis]|uniref:Mll5186 protein n=1 Tax=Variibacter gotjawalensis TaxID=1333996 RepID=A0A0S3PS43_9BRAD|nr:hypothetical protein [Variibacter gotjawalensis]NIK49086.1 hypothetical protein [Variibacter gotjawalensis]RZS50942.1 hypothetical protein EV661_3414 [Variibacter gotjawalensis]BAT58776.1 hypothetical protein GJW-30_1_01303 [Variibacter gotjawalensis]